MSHWFSEQSRQFDRFNGRNGNGWEASCLASGYAWEIEVSNYKLISLSKEKEG